MQSRKRFNLVVGFAAVTFMTTVTVFQSNYDFRNDIIERINNYQEYHKRLFYSEEKLKDGNFDCSIIDAITKSTNRSNILKTLDYKIDIEYDDIQSRQRETVTHRPIFNCLSADDPYLTKSIKEDLMIPPQRKENVTYPGVYFYSNQELDAVQMIFKDYKKGGFFIEVGATDCSVGTSTVRGLEESLFWTGLLIEAMPGFFRKCKTAKRSAWMINTCLATQDSPHNSDFNVKSAGDFMTHDNKMHVLAMPGFSGNDFKNNSVQFQCLPLASLLFALGNPTVNFFVLDIEGFELAVLRTIPWDKVDIEVFSIETDLAGKFQKDSSREGIIDLMVSNGYTRFNHRNDINAFTNTPKNDLFVRNDIVKSRLVEQL